MLTLKQQRKRNLEILQETIRDSDLDKLDVTFGQIETLLNGLSDKGKDALSPIFDTVQQARNNINQISASPGVAIPDSLVTKTVSQLVLLQSTLVQVFQQLPKLLRIVKGNLNKHLSKGAYEGILPALKKKYLVENHQSMTLKEIFLLLEQEKVINLTALNKKLYQQAQEKGIVGDMDAKTFRDEVIKPAMESLGIKAVGGGRAKFTEEQVNTLISKVFDVREPGSRKTSKTAEKKEISGVESPVWVHLSGDTNVPDNIKAKGDEAVQNYLRQSDAVEGAKNLIVNATKPKGFFKGLWSAMKGEGLPLGLDATALANGILSLSLQDFTKIVDNADTIKIQMDTSKAKEVAQETGKTPEEKSAGNKMSLGNMEKAMVKNQVSPKTVNQVVSFFKTLVGKGPVEFTE